MLVTIAYCAKDLPEAERLAGWLRELGPYSGHKLLVARDRSTQARPFKALGFDSSEEIEVIGDVWRKWPESCNNAFGEVARYVEELKKEPWLWLEPDVVPLSKGWLDAIAEEYKGCGKPFLGDYVSVHTPELDVPDHMSGVAVYPWAMSRLAGRCLIAHDVAWDVFAKDQILGLMARSKLIHHSWKHHAFADWEQVEREVLAFKPGCVLFHADKMGSLYPLLRARMGLQVEAVEEPSRHQSRQGISVSSSPTSADAAPICDIFIKSYPADYEWLGYCLRSIERFVSGVRKVVIVAPDRAFKIPKESTERAIAGGLQWIETPDPCEDGYLAQQVLKLSAPEYSDADFILHTDSDTLFTRPVGPETYLRDGKPVWMFTPYSQLGEVPWREPTEKFLGESVEFEFMRRLPVMVPAWAYPALASFCLEKHGVNLSDYIAGQPASAFSEYNALGAFLYRYHREKIGWVNTAETPEAQWPELTVNQRWSYGGVDEGIKGEFEEILQAELVSAAEIRQLRASLKRLYSTTGQMLRRIKEPEPTL